MVKSFLKSKVNIQSYLYYFSVFSLLIFSFAPYANSAVLSHGPVVGGVTANEAKVFVRTDVAATVAIEYSTDPNFQTFLITNNFQTTSVTNFTKIIPLSVLNPQTTYYLNVYVNDVPQFSADYPSFKTFPATRDSQPFRFIILTDFQDPPRVTQPSLTFLNASREAADFVFIGGDFSHGNPTTLGKKRKMFKQLYTPNSLGLGDFINGILRKMPIIHHWDDHDAGKNNLDKTYPYWGRSYRVFNEYVPTYDLPPVSFGIWQYFQYAHADFFVLDGRSQRDPDADPDDIHKSMLDGNNLGSAGQLEWLKQGLLNSTGRWKIIFSSVPVNPTTKPRDSWAAFQTEWKNLKKFIQDNNINGVIFISGDLHRGGIDNGNASGFPEMVVPSANLSLSYCEYKSSWCGYWSEGIYFNRIGSCDGYGVVTVLTNPDRLLLEVKDQDGNTRLSYTVY